MITSLVERRGGHKKLYEDNRDFQSLIDELNIVDIETANGNHTWNNKRGGSHQVATRLDHFLIFESIVIQGTMTQATILPSWGSYHWPVSIETHHQASPSILKKFCLEHPNFQENIITCWKEAEITKGTIMYNFPQRLENLKEKLKKWNKEVFGDICIAQKNMEIRMTQLQQ